MMFTYKALIAVVLVSLWAFILPAWISWFTDQEPTLDTAAAYSVDQTDYGLRLTSYAALTGNSVVDNNNTYSYDEQSSTDTPAGTHVITSLPDAVVDFETITAQGISSVITTSKNPVGTSIPDCTIFGDFIDISTTATYTGKIALGLEYPDHTVMNEKDLRLFHWNGAEWEDVTTWVDSERNTVYGVVNSLSWFFIGGHLVWKENSAPVITSVIAETLFLVDEISDVWITDTVNSTGDCEMGKTVGLEVTECGQALWSMCEWIMNDSIVSWKYWLPAVVDVTQGLSVGSAISD